MEPLDARSMISAASTATATAVAGDGAARVERRRRLTPAALAVTNEKVRPAYSPIVIEGGVRLADFLVIALVGIALYFGYVVQVDEFSWSYVGAILAIAAVGVISFQSADVYDVEAFRRQLGQLTRLLSAWAFVFLIFIAASFLAKAGDAVSRLWLSAFFFCGIGLLTAERLALRSLVRRWARQKRPARPAHHHRRRRRQRRESDPRARD